MMAKLPEMNSDFARWYTEAFMDEGQTSTARWKGVVDTAAAADHNTVEVLVRYAFATTARADGGKNEVLANKHRAVLATISGSGALVDPTTNRRELQVLSAAVLARLFSTLPDAAIAVSNASFDGSRTADLPMDLTGLARRALLEFTRNKHARSAEEEFEIKPPKVDFQVSEEALGSMTAPQWKSELDRLRDAAQTAARVLVDGQNRVAKQLVRQISLGDEELQMLWWLIGGHSSVANAPFTEVDNALRPLAYGKELGELTAVSPGPASVRALLSRAGVDGEALRISDAVNAADLGWIRNVTESARVSPITTPLHFALEKRAEVGSDDAWLPVWASMTGLPAEATLSAVKLAELFYHEHIFLYVA